MIAVRLTASNPPRRTNEPVTIGVPFPRGLLRDASQLRLTDSTGTHRPLQAEVLNAWSDGSARWVLCDFQATLDGVGEYRLAIDPSAESPKHEDLVAWLPKKIPIGSQVIRLHSSDRCCYPNARAIPSLEETGSLRGCVIERGDFTHNNVPVAEYTLRIHCFNGLPIFRVHLTLENNRPAAHPGGMWDLGEVSSVLVDRLSIVVGTVPAPVIVSRDPADPGVSCRAFDLMQWSGGGEHWWSGNHRNRSGEVMLLNRGYTFRCDAGNTEPGLRATPVVWSEDRTFACSVPHFWQNFPQQVRFVEHDIELSLLCANPTPLELQGGERREFVFYIAEGRDTITDEPLAWTRSPVVAVVDPEWVASSGAIPYLVPQAADPHREYQALTDAAIVGEETFEKKREVIDEYGWRNFGDIYGDHEAILHTTPGEPPRVSHYNNQYDPIAGFAVHWLRSGDVRWFAAMNELASHVRDIDIYHTDQDKAAYNHGLFWHTYHYVDADTGTHRAYPKRGRVPPHGKPVPGGGPGGEQNYAHGLMLNYFLTGDEASREAAVGLADWVIAMDDGNRTVFRWLSRSETGLASASRSPDYHGPGRGAANSVAVLLDGLQLTGDRKYLDKSEQLIRRVIHPSDDVTRMVGVVKDGVVAVDAENRWFYVMFLQSLGKYLDVKAERGEIDAMYALARASLLHYARWMAKHEYPYLSRPELLEYPTETWAAQDLWKSEVFDFVTLHAEGQERALFREKAAFFHAESVRQLSTMPTRTLCRPVVLLLTHGWRRAWFAANPEASRPKPSETVFPAKVAFVPQKAIAKKRAKMLLAGAFVLGVAGVVALIVGLLR